MDADKKPMTNSNALKDRIFVSEWRDALEVGDAQLDAEHRRLFMRVKQLDLEHLDTSMQHLQDYMLSHFQHEQDLMTLTHYPRLLAHIDLHDDFKCTVDRLWLSQVPWTEQRVMDLKRFLNEWLIGHIGVHDQHFGNWRRSTQARLGNTSSAAATPAPAASGMHFSGSAIRKAWHRWTGNQKDVS
jgi:hemerythrin-like metal-binding protein